MVMLLHTLHYSNFTYMLLQLHYDNVIDYGNIITLDYGNIICVISAICYSNVITLLIMLC